MFLRTPADIGAAIKDRRKQLKIGQAELGRRVGVSRQWIIAVEKGHDRAELALVLSVLNALDLRLDVGGADREMMNAVRFGHDDPLSKVLRPMVGPSNPGIEMNLSPGGAALCGLRTLP